MNDKANDIWQQIEKQLKTIRPLDADAVQKAREYQNSLLKPPESLGTIEAIAIQIAGITGKLHNTTERKVHFLFGSDHGIYEEGVSAAPQYFTRVLMEAYAKGAGGGINVLCRQANADLRLIDMGVKELPSLPAVDTKYRLMPNGSDNFAKGPAMPRETAAKAVMAGIELVASAAQEGYQIVGAGEVGMGNTTPAAASIMALLKISDPAAAVGRGGGLTDEAYDHKKQVIAAALRMHQPDPDDPLDVLAKVGGLDIAAMTGVFLGCAVQRLPVIIDGVISAAAALAAYRAVPTARDFMIASHQSKEPGYSLASEYLGLSPMLNLGMRLGEGSGCPLAMQLVDDALAIMNSMNTFDGVSLDSEYQKGIRV